jgi:hypothetical protein
LTKDEHMPVNEPTNEQRDAHYAVVVGIDHYVYVDVLPSLSGASADAGRFVNWLLKPAGGGLTAPRVRAITTTGVSSSDFNSSAYEEVDIRVVIGALGEVNQEMVERIRSGLEPGVYERSRLYIFFAGHGVMAPGAEVALLTSEAGMPGVFGWGVNVTDLMRWYFDHGPFKQVICFADCCRTYHNDVQFGPVNFNKYRHSGLSPSWTVQGYATLPNEVSLEKLSADGIRGVFSRSLVEALEEDVDPLSGRIDHKRLSESVGRRVYDATHPPQPPPPQDSVFKFGELAYNDLIHFGRN